VGLLRRIRGGGGWGAGDFGPTYFAFGTARNIVLAG
jgi:hypothetical protein